MNRKSKAKLAAERAAVVDTGQVWRMVFAEVVAWQDEHGGGQDERAHADRITGALVGRARTGLTKVGRYQLITATVAQMMTDPIKV